MQIPLIPAACFAPLSTNPAHAMLGKAHVQQLKSGVRWVSAAPTQAEETE